MRQSLEKTNDKNLVQVGDMASVKTKVIAK